MPYDTTDEAIVQLLNAVLTSKGEDGNLDFQKLKGELIKRRINVQLYPKENRINPKRVTLN
jgi:hypothetical protein